MERPTLGAAATELRLGYRFLPAFGDAGAALAAADFWAAHRLFCASLIALRAFADIFRRFGFWKIFLSADSDYRRPSASRERCRSPRHRAFRVSQIGKVLHELREFGF